MRIRPSTVLTKAVQGSRVGIGGSEKLTVLPTHLLAQAGQKELGRKCGKPGTSSCWSGTVKER